MKADLARYILHKNNFNYEDVISLIKKACEENKDCIFLRKDTNLIPGLVSKLIEDGYDIFYISNKQFNLIGISWTEKEVKIKKKTSLQKLIDWSFG